MFTRQIYIYEIISILNNLFLREKFSIKSQIFSIRQIYQEKRGFDSLFQSEGCLMAAKVRLDPSRAKSVALLLWTQQPWQNEPIISIKPRFCDAINRVSEAIFYVFAISGQSNKFLDGQIDFFFCECVFREVCDIFLILDFMQLAILARDIHYFPILS